MRKHLGWAALVASLLLVLPPAVRAQLEVLELKAANYDPVAGIWHDTSGNGNDASGGIPPALTLNATKNGKAVVTFDGVTTYLQLTTGVQAAEYTVFAYVRPMPGDSRTIVGGGTGSFQWRIGGDGFGDVQEVLQRNLVRLGISNTNLDTTGTVFSNISALYSTAPGTFQIGETDDGMPVQSYLFYSATNLVGAASGPGEMYGGDIAEIRIYDVAIWDPAIRAAIEEEIRKTYEP
jgi:hypothetical protein